MSYIKKRNIIISAVFVAISAIVCGAGAIYTTFVHAELKNETDSYIKDIIAEETVNIDLMMQQNMEKVDMLSVSLSDYKSLDSVSLKKDLSNMAEKTEFSSFLLIDENGDVVVSSDSKTDGNNMKDRAYFKQAINGKSNISQTIRTNSEYGGISVNMFATPIYGSYNRINGVVVGVYENNLLSEMMTMNILGNKYNCYVFSNDGNFQVKPDDDVLNLGNNFFKDDKINSYLEAESIEQIKQNLAMVESVNFADLNIDGKSMFMAYSNINMADWCVSVVLPTSVSDARATNFVWMTLIFSASLVLLVVLLATYIIIYQRKSKIALREKTDEYRRLAFVDELTGYSTWNKFVMKSQQLFADRSVNYALVSFDIDKFRAVNDMFGHEQGNKILKLVADAVNRNITADETFSRINSDNFYMLLTYDKQDDIAEKVRNIIQDVQYQIVEFKPILSFGIYCITDRRISVRKMGDRADLAKRTIKYGNDSNFAFYYEALSDEVRHEKEIEDVMEVALESREFLVYYQPKIDLNNSSKIIGAEALVRWLRNGKIVPPGEFIPLFEKNHFVIKIDMFVLEEVCKQQKYWLSMGYEPILISVNMSRVHLTNPAFARQLKEMCDKYEVPTSLIEIEITESVAFEDLHIIAQVFKELKDYGFKISIDDFGTGYSSLNMLKDLPVDILKIDREFLTDTTNNTRASNIIGHVIALALSLGIQTICEGIETEEQVNLLRNLGCDMAQGYYFARPMTLDKFQTMLRKR